MHEYGAELHIYALAATCEAVLDIVATAYV
jgi:hypothetical protein